MPDLVIITKLLSGLLKPLGALVGQRLLSKVTWSDDFSKRTTVRKYFASDAEYRRAERLFEHIADCILHPVELFIQGEARFATDKTLAPRIVDALHCLISDGKLSLKVFNDSLYSASRISASLRAEISRNRSFPPSALFSHARWNSKNIDFDETEIQYFLTALDVFVTSSCDILISLEPFRVEREKVILGSLANLIGKVEIALSALLSLERQIRRSDDITGFERWYRLELSKKVNYLDLLGIDVPRGYKQIPLEIGYINLNINLNENQRSNSSNEPAAAVFDRCLKQRTSLLIRGEAGSGKTTLLRWLAYHLTIGQRTLYEITSGKDYIQRELTGASAVHWQAVPFLIQLRSHIGAPISINTLTAYCAHLGDAPHGWIQAKLDEGAVILLDGIDEIPQVERKPLLEFISYIRERYPKTIIIATSRPRSVEPKDFNDLNFLQAVVNPLADSDKYRLVDHWYLAMAMATDTSFRDAAQKARQLRNLFEQDVQLGALTTTPLLCAAICALYRQAEGQLPHRLNSLCEALVRMLLDRRDRESGIAMPEFGGAGVSGVSLDYERKKLVCAHVADYMVRNGEARISEVRFAQLIEDAFAGFYGIELTSEFVEYLLERSGLLRQEMLGAVDFVHNNLRDYLASYAYLRRRDFRFLARHAFDREWQNLILFVCGAATKEEIEELINSMIERLDEAGEGNNSDLQANKLFVLRCGFVAVELSRTTQSVIRNLAAQFIPPNTVEEAYVVATAGDEIASQLGYESSRDSSQQLSCIRALGLMKSPAAAIALRSYCRDVHPELLQELIRYINPLELESYREKVIRGEALSPEVSNRIIDLEPITTYRYITQLDLSYSYVSDISRLAEFKDLETLKLDRVPALDFTPISNCKKLKHLQLAFCRVEDATFLEELADLEYLDLDYSDIADISFVRKLSKLRYLGVRRTSVPAQMAIEASRNRQLKIGIET